MSFILRVTMRSAIYSLVFMLCLVVLAPVQGFAAQQINQDELKEAVKNLLKEQPELVLDILKDNSEIVLEIAQQGNIQRRRKLLQSQWQADSKTAKNPVVASRPFRGAEKAPVTIITYSDYTCSYCRQVEGILDELLGKYGNSTIKILFKPLPKDTDTSILSAQYSVAAFLQDSKKAWAFHDLLFQEAAGLDAGGKDFLISAASRAGLDVVRLEKDAASKQVATLMKVDDEEADRLGITGTPFFLINDLVIRGAVSKDVFEEAILYAAELKKNTK